MPLTVLNPMSTNSIRWNFVAELKGMEPDPQGCSGKAELAPSSCLSCHRSPAFPVSGCFAFEPKRHTGSAPIFLPKFPLVSFTLIHV